MVGPSLSQAPYTSINAAITSASSSAGPGSQQIVYIQSGAYTENVVMVPYVHLISLDTVLSQEINIIPPAASVLLNGSINMTAGLSAMDVIVQGISIITVPGGDPAISAGNAFNVRLNLRNCVIFGSQNDAVVNNNPNFTLNVYNSTLQAATTRRVFNFTQGILNVENSKTFATDTVSLIDGSVCTITNSYCGDSFTLLNSGSLTAKYSTIEPPLTLTAVNLSTVGTSANITNSTITCNSPMFAITGVAGASFAENLNVYTDNPLVQSALTKTIPGIHIGNMSFNHGVYYVNPTSSGNSSPNFNPGTYNLGLNKVLVTTSSVSMSANSEYLVLIPGNVHLLLPSTAAIGDIIRITGLFLGGIDLTFIDQNAGQSISIGGSQTTGGVTGQCYGSSRNSITLQCLGTNTTWICIGVVGTYTLT
jgi:hypothetical protein